MTSSLLSCTTIQMQLFPLRVDPFYERKQQFGRIAAPACESIYLNNLYFYTPYHICIVLDRLFNIFPKYKQSAQNMYTPNFLQVVVHVLSLTNEIKSHLYTIRVTVMYSRAIFVTVTSDCPVKSVICTT